MTPAKARRTKAPTAKARKSAPGARGAAAAAEADVFDGTDLDGAAPLSEVSAGAEDATPLGATSGAQAFIGALERGDPWYPALLQVVARWVDPMEVVDGVVYRYLVGGEAFDWLRLAERLIAAAGDRIPAEEAERLLFLGSPPSGVDSGTDEEFARIIGHQKYRAHLNFLYGVTVEEALLFLAEIELQKARSVLEGSRSLPADVAAYERVYGKPLDELLVLYRTETNAALANRASQSEVHAFTYWCWKYRVKWHDPARVASDTRRALAQLSRMEVEGRARALQARAAAEPPNVIDVD